MRFDSFVEYCDLVNTDKRKDYKAVFKTKDGVEHNFNSFEVLNSEKKIALSDIGINEW